MSSSGYDEMGPKIDLGPAQDVPEPGPMPGPPPPPKPPRAKKVAIKPPVAPVKRRRGNVGALMVAIISLLVALLAIGVSAFVMVSQPTSLPDAGQSPEVMPGGTVERVAKLEKDVSGLILRLVTLEKELRAVSDKAGSVTRLTELSAKVAALQTRLDALTLRTPSAPRSAPVGGQGGGDQDESDSPSAAAAPGSGGGTSAQAEESGDTSAPSNAKRMVYTVRSGDSLFDIALRYKVSVRNLKLWNKMRSNKIVSGQKLVIYK